MRHRRQALLVKLTAARDNPMADAEDLERPAVCQMLDVVIQELTDALEDQ